MSKLIAILMLTLALPACTNSEQAEETARQERREAEMRRLQQERQAAEQRTKEEQKVQPEPEEPAAPSEPEYREITTYFFTSNTEKVAVACNDEGTMHECGVTFEDCNGSAYYCQTGVKVFSKTKKELVTE